MVSQPRPPSRPRRQETSRDRIFQAAAVEFAARGFDGAKVDRIAARARLNKAMLYYHFCSKAALYREVLVDMFASTARAVGAIRGGGGTPETQLAGFIEAIAREGQARRHFPAIWLREIAEGGRHLDEPVMAHVRSVLATLGAILDEGRRARVFRAVPPFVAQVGIVGPLLLFMASAPIRERFGRRGVPPIAVAPAGAMVEYVKTMTLAAVGTGCRASAAAGRRRTRA